MNIRLLVGLSLFAAWLCALALLARSGTQGPHHILPADQPAQQAKPAQETKAAQEEEPAEGAKPASEAEDFPVREAYSMWLQIPTPQAYRLSREIERLAGLFEGTQHGPHVTLCGSVFTDEKEVVLRTAEALTSALSPFNLIYSRLAKSKFKSQARWRSSITLRFHDNPLFFAASELCTSAFANASYAKPFNISKAQTYAHSTILYDWTGRSIAAFKEVYPLQGAEFIGTDFTATSFSVVYTPHRDWYSSAADMQEVVARWRLLRTFHF